MNTVLLALICGAMVGFCLGALGGGGGILVWPALFLGIGLSTDETSLQAKIIVAVCASFAGFMHYRKGTIDFKAVAAMSVLGIAGSALGARFVELTGMDEKVAERTTLALLAVIMLVVAALMLRKGLRSRGEEASKTEPAAVRPMAAAIRWPLFVLASLAIGFLTGFLGVGGGFMIVPVLVLVYQLPMNIAAGTSLVVITLNCISGIAASTVGAIRWDVAFLFAVSSITASAFAVRVADRAKQSTLQIVFSGLIVVLGVMTAWKLSIT